MIGQKIRSKRKSKNLTIVELSEQIDVTSGYISQIERDLISPSLSVLKRLSEALEIPLSSLFLEEDTNSVVTIQQADRTKVKFGNINVEVEFITPLIRNNDKSNNVEAFMFKLKPRMWLSEQTIIHESKECMYVLCGKIECHIGSNIYNVSKGDSLCVPENTGHMILNNSDGETEVMCIISPAIY